MRNLSWNIRILIGILVLAIVLVIGIAVFYNVVRAGYTNPMGVEIYPSAELMFDGTPDNGVQQQVYAVQGDGTQDIPTVAQDIQSFYEDEGFECSAQYGTIYENAVRLEDAYLQSNCFKERSHTFGFTQFSRITIQPERRPYQYLDGNPENQITGGGDLTGLIAIEIMREWDSSGILGG